MYLKDALNLTQGYSYVVLNLFVYKLYIKKLSVIK